MVEVECASPYDLELSVRAMRGFGNETRNENAAGGGAEPGLYRFGAWLEGRPTALEVRQASAEPAVLSATSRPASEPAALHRLVARVVSAAMDLRPFYRLVEGHPVLGWLSVEFHGLKPFRPPSLFEMLVMAVTEQQLSLAASHHIQARLIERFGAQADGLSVFPSPQALAGASLLALNECGLSRRKAEYVSGLARLVLSGDLDLDALEQASDDEVRQAITRVRGFGKWSADYVLVRGLGRADVVPFDDLGVRRVVGNMLADGRVLTAQEAEKALAAFAPCRGLAVFYLLVASHLLNRTPRTDAWKRLQDGKPNTIGSASARPAAIGGPGE